MRTRRSTLLGVALAATLVATVGTSAHGKAPAPAGEVTAAVPPSSKAAQVTLVTGDVVTVTTQGGKPAITVTPHDGPVGNFRTYSVGTDVYVVPLAVEPLIATGQVDRRLFNVTGLIAQGYDDAHDTSIPLIVKYPAGAAGRAGAPSAPAGSRVKRSLPSIRGAAIAADKKQAATFWEAVDDDTARARTPKARLAGGIERLWLDGKVHALLDQSVPQIGAPAAWAAGYDGTGVKVAVLDTGADLNHPDLAGKITESRSFVPGESVDDGHGHGTHVAATIAGTGAASGGRHKGVAPGAQLLVGKVLADEGGGAESWIIAGMDWAAHSGAKVVSMSLGGVAGEGVDPMAEAVDQLTAETGVLFTIASGNSGPGATTVGSPGIAASALTVGAVNRADAVTSFSSRGPLASGALKPEITAPGAGIVAARAAGTSMGTPVDDHYTAASGTSMATPHVAGAAAILAQQHPDWTPARLKSQLVSTAKTTADTSVYAQGAGRTDVSRAVRQPVSGPGVVDFGLQAWESTAPVTRQLTYVNDGDQPVTLALTTRGAAGQLPAGALTLGADTVTVPARGTADVTVTANSGVVPPGAYGAHVTAASADGGTVVTTAVGFVRDSERFNVNVKLMDLDGKAPASTYSSVWVFDLDNPGPADIHFILGAEGTLELRLPRGEYAFEAGIYRFTPDYQQVRDHVYGAESGIVVDSDRTITFDGSKSSQVSIQTPKPSQPQRVRMGMSLLKDDKSLMYGLQTEFNGYTKLHAIPSQFKSENLEHRLAWSLAAPALEAQLVSPGAFPITPEYVGGWVGSARIDGTQVLGVVNAGLGRPQDYAGKAVKGKLALVRRSDGLTPRQQIDNAAAAGAGAILIYNDLPAEWGTDVYQKTPTAIPAMTLSGEQGGRLAGLADRGGVLIQLKGTAVSPYSYELIKYQHGISADQRYQVSPEELATVDTSFHASTPGTEAGYSRFLLSPLQSFIVMTLARTTMPRSLTEYVTAGRPTWELMAPAGVWESMPGFQQTLPSVFEPGQRLTRAWNKPVVRSAIPAGRPEGAVRVGDVGVVFTTGLLDEATGQYLTIPNNTDKALTTVYRDGQLLGSAPAAAVAFPMTPERARYRVVTDVRRDQPWWTTSTKVNTAWTFHSQQAGDRALLPVLSVGYDLDVDLDNTVQAQSTVGISLDFWYPKDLAGLRIREAKLWASYDDGVTWRQVTVTAGGDATVKGAIKSPALDDTNGFVSLRVQATDADGNTVEQTVTRAYKLRG
ncbi:MULTISPECIES: S8 family serine peptidase [unclassified Micromonospora]|uniref:S8 family serine peptidase n=1 Tax=unclassified Micromonospora TaxID=2617518 RepID=UPI0033182B6C